MFNSLHLIKDLVRYNLKIIFANKFVYFLLAATAVFLLVAAISLFNSDSYPDESTVYYALILPGLLIIFYPTAFGIQNDLDSGMLELLSGIPNYRYKVWLVRLVIIYFVAYFVLLMLSLLASLTMFPVSILDMSFQLMFPVFFFGTFAFMLSTYIRNGNGTAAVMAIVSMGFWISSGILQTSKWNIFLNPFELPGDMDEVIWIEIIFYNRLYLLIGIFLSVLTGLYNLQRREKFI